MRLLYRLQELRPAGRYLDKDLALSDGEPDALFELLAEMQAHVARVVEDDAEGEDPRGFTVIARRAVRAGQIVTQNDFTLKPIQAKRALR